uniref:Uncharacterized protein n=1 Tax=Tanacetum cinerariifolium TaxID=118510 RepID=A0A6L2NXM3_TANCI|nr:hypothetical protein [Tanacetum cinerariifolium]
MTTGLDYSSLLEFDLFSDPEDHFEEKVAKAMREPTMEEFMTITRINYESENKKGRIKLKGRFLIELRDNAFSGTNGEDAIEHIENFLKIVDLLNVPNISQNFFGKFYTPSRTGREIEANGDNTKVEWDPTNIEFENWLGSKFRNHKTMNQYTKNALWNYWRKDMIEDSKLKEEALINKAILEESMNVGEESSNKAWSHYSPIDEWKDYEHTTYIKTDASSNQNTYNNVCQIITDHYETQEKQGWFDEHELMKDVDDDTGDLEDYLIRKDPPY